MLPETYDDIKTTVTFMRQPELIDTVILELFGPDEINRAGHIVKHEELPNTVTFSSAVCREFCKKMNDIRGIEPALRSRFPILFGSILN